MGHGSRFKLKHRLYTCATVHRRIQAQSRTASCRPYLEGLHVSDSMHHPRLRPGHVDVDIALRIAAAAADQDYGKCYRKSAAHPSRPGCHNAITALSLRLRSTCFSNEVRNHYGPSRGRHGKKKLFFWLGGGLCASLTGKRSFESCQRTRQGVVRRRATLEARKWAASCGPAGFSCPAGLSWIGRSLPPRLSFPLARHSRQLLSPTERGLGHVHTMSVRLTTSCATDLCVLLR